MNKGETLWPPLWCMAENLSANKLTFPLQLVIIIVSTALTAMASVWAVQYTLRSDVRDILTRMEMQVKIAESQSQLQNERSQQLKSAIESMQRRQELQQYEIQGLKETIMGMKGGAR